MHISRKILWLALVVFVFAGCKQKKKVSLSGEEPVEIADFIEFFKPLSLPWQANDTIFNKKEKDSTLISYKNFALFVPDSVIKKLFGKGIKPKIYSFGKVEVPKAETYLFVKTITGFKKTLLILAFDGKQKFVAAFPALQAGMVASTTHSVSMDKKYTITKTVVRKNADGSLSEGKDVWVLDASTRDFSLVMTDALDEKPTELINPIDTMSQKNKFTGDYSNGKMNLVSVRDGKRTDRITFFIHFEKDNGKCTGELKGDALMRKSNMAEYRVGGDPCVLQFIFSSSAVTLKEVEGCGARRGLNCSFDGSFAKKKKAKPAIKLKTK
jgi:hypothetical protein